MRHIESIGIEFECGMPYDYWCSLQRGRNYGDRLDVGSDSTVYVQPPTYEYASQRGGWERDVEIRFWSRSYREILDLIEEAFKNGAIQNSTCGNHVHIKFRDTRVLSLFADYRIIKKFEKLYKAKWAGRQKFAERLRNSYCSSLSKENFILALADSGSRYSSVNFKSFWKHGTLEFRILPYASSFEEWKEMFLWLLETVEELAIKAVWNKAMTIKVPDIVYNLEGEEGEV